MLIDTHCHLDAAVFDADRDAVALRALELGVSAIVIPSVAPCNFDDVLRVCARHAHCMYALGIHPMYVQGVTDEALTLLKAYVVQHQPVAIGEIGLDYFAYKPAQHPEQIARQIFFFTEQLKLAQTHDLPVILHVRHAIDDVLKYLRRHSVVGGIVHAFNGSLQQAEQLIDMGFKLGFGGAMTYTRALKIRELAKTLPIEAIVLETDAPDIPPAWLDKGGRNSPIELMKIAAVLADLRGVSVAQVVDITGGNARQALPKLVDLCTPPHVLL